MQKPNRKLLGSSGSGKVIISNNNYSTEPVIENGANSSYSNNIKNDPLLVDPDKEDFHLQSGSPCINAGNANAPRLPSTDFEKEPRSVGSFPDIGADEYNDSPYNPIPSIDGYEVTDNLRIGAVIITEEKGPIEAAWKKGGEDITDRGDMVIWGHFYASPSDVTWGSENNPDLFVKIWFDASGRVDINFFHVSVPDIEVYSDLPDGTYDQKDTTIYG